MVSNLTWQDNYCTHQARNACYCNTKIFPSESTFTSNQIKYNNTSSNNSNKRYTHRNEEDKLIYSMRFIDFSLVFSKIFKYFHILLLTI